MQLACAKKAVGNFAIGLKQPRTSIQMFAQVCLGLTRGEIDRERRQGIRHAVMSEVCRLPTERIGR